MKTKAKKKHTGLIIFLILLCAAFLAALAAGVRMGLKVYKRNSSQQPNKIYAGILAELEPPAPESDRGKLLFSAANSLWEFDLGATQEKGLWDVSIPMSFRYLDSAKLVEGLDEEINTKLQSLVEAASRSSEVYDSQMNYREDVLETVLDDALKARIENPEEYLSSGSLELRFHFSDETWELLNSEELEKIVLSSRPENYDRYAESLRTLAEENAEFIPLHYEIDEHALAGYKPDQDLFGSTADPSVIEALLASPQAKLLIGEQSLAWSPDIELIPGTEILYYLDESILALVWQEEEAQAVGTFSEIFIADGSQLRRRIAGDELWSYQFETASSFAEKTNSVLTFGGDMYHHGRGNGIVVYDRSIARFEPKTSDICYITSQGDMLFTYREEFEDQEQAQTFIEENDILFSLCFGPVLIDKGEDVTPWIYPWGEIQDVYARSCLGMLGDKHYLTMNINCQLPDHYYLATLRQAADAMMEKGCIKAYALDGGQTATTVFNGKLINPVQFGTERPVSDVIYFATAVPNNED